MSAVAKPAKKPPLFSADVIRKAIPTKKQMQIVFDLAVECSSASHHFEHDDDGEVIGKDPEIVEAINTVGRYYKLRGRVER